MEPNTVRHYCPPGFDYGHMLRGILRDIDRNYVPGRTHIFHAHEKGAECDLVRCRVVGVEGTTKESSDDT